MSQFNKNLRTHLSFISRSCELYDDGHTEEALRIAVSLRVIFHNTNNSTSLLKHLNKKDSVSLISTFVSQKSLGSRYGNIQWHTIIPVMLTSDGVKPPTDNWKTRSILSAEDWWNEQIWLEGQFALSRKDIVLSAANQDGGAHVDSNPSAKTRKLRAGPKGTVIINEKMLAGAMTNHHHPLIRQFAHEVLSSDELCSLANIT
jgi:hypothetical protein